MSDQDDDAKFAELCDDIHGDLAKRIDAFDSSMLVKFVALVEVIGEDSDRAVFSVSSRDMKTWESLGMLEFARQLEQAAAVREDGGP